MRMKTILRVLGFVLVLSGLQSFSGTRLPGGRFPGAHKFPWGQAGLTQRQAAEHLLSRFTYGAEPGQVEAVMQEGLENWFARQLAADLPDDTLEALLRPY